MECILYKGCVIRIRLGHKEILREVVAFSAGYRAHPDQEGCEITPVLGRVNRLIRRRGVEAIPARRCRRLANIQKALHKLESGTQLVLPHRLRQRHVGVAVFTRIYKGIPVRRSSYPSSDIPEVRERQSLVDLLSR